jgi:hypothetical protein
MADAPQFGYSRREALRHSACGFGSLALAGLCNEAFAAPAADQGAAADAGIGTTRDPAVAATRRDPLAPRAPHFAARAKRIIFLFMQGGPSQVDTFDPKPRLDQEDGKRVPFRVARTRKVTDERLLKSPWKFARYGQSGRWVSELFPEMARHVDDLCFIHSMHTEGVAHGPSTLALHTGSTSLIRPSMGSWVVYGLGTENENLPGFVTISPSARMGGPRNYSNAFLPAAYQGTVIGRAGLPATQAGIQHLTNESLTEAQKRRRFRLMQAINRQQIQQSGNPDDELEAVIDSFELAYRMQSHAPQLLDLSGETKQTLQQYGIGQEPTDNYGRQCLMARRLAESGVRFIQVNYSDNSNNPRWDQHSNLPRHADHAKAIDLPVAGLLQDLKSRGLLEDTLVWWGGEFGRTPFAQGRDGRDHNPDGFTLWLAGAGVKPGFAYGATDEFGFSAAVDKVHMHDLHATLLHLMGLDHLRLTYRNAGRDFRLTDVAGRVVEEIFV